MQRGRVGAAVMTAAVAMGSMGLAGAAEPEQGSAPPAEVLACARNAVFGIGATRTTTCATALGTLGPLRFGSGSDLNAGDPYEGYVVCVGNVGASSYANTKDGGVGIVPVSITPAGVTPVVVVTRTTNNAMTIRSTFEKATNAGGVRITMQVTNTSGSALQNVRLSRYLDVDADGFQSDRGTNVGLNSLRVVDSNSGYGVVMVSNSPGSRQLQLYGGLVNSRNRCSGAAVPAGTVGDLAARLTTPLGNIPAGASRSVIYGYTRA